MLEVLSRRIAKKLKENNPSSDIEVLEYGLALRLNMISIILITCLCGYILGHIIHSIFALIALCIIRRFSGGIHFKSLTVCMLTTSLFCTIAPMLSLDSGLTFVLTILSIIIFLAKAPNWFEDIRSVNKSHYKLISTMIVCSNLIIQSDMLAVIFLVQAITLLPTRGGVNHEKDNGKVFEQTN